MRKLIYIVLVCMVFSGCKTTTKLVEEKTRYTWFVDSFYIHDSVNTKVLYKTVNDTVYRDSVVVVIRTIDRYRQRDSLYIDTIKTAKKLDGAMYITTAHKSWWDFVKACLQWIGGIIIVLGIGIVVFKVKKVF